MVHDEGNEMADRLTGGTRIDSVTVINNEQYQENVY